MGLAINTVFWIVVLSLLVLLAVLTVVVRTLPVATVLLAATSVVLTIILYVAGYKLAAVIELTVSAGLVTAILASAIALLKPQEEDSESTKKGGRIGRYLPLLVILPALAAAVYFFFPGQELNFGIASNQVTQDVLWSDRALDIIALALLILAGVLGVAALIKRREEK